MRVESHVKTATMYSSSRPDAKQGFKIAKDEAVDRAESAENSLRDANFRVEKAKEEMMALEKKYSQIRHDLETSHDELGMANEKLELREKTLHQVNESHDSRDSTFTSTTGRTGDGRSISSIATTGRGARKMLREDQEHGNQAGTSVTGSRRVRKVS